MAEPVPFPESNLILRKPESMTDEECAPLHVWTDGTRCISCWRPTVEDLERLVRGAPIWLWVTSGATQPPVAVSTEHPFVAVEEKLPG